MLALSGVVIGTFVFTIWWSFGPSLAILNFFCCRAASFETQTSVAAEQFEDICEHYQKHSGNEYGNREYNSTNWYTAPVYIF